MRVGGSPVRRQMALAGAESFSVRPLIALLMKSVRKAWNVLILDKILGQESTRQKILVRKVLLLQKHTDNNKRHLSCSLRNGTVSIMVSPTRVPNAPPHQSSVINAASLSVRIS